MKIEFGGYYDNFEAFQFAKREIELGRAQEGLEILRKLKRHIHLTKDSKSARNLLYNIAFYEESAINKGAALVAMI